VETKQSEAAARLIETLSSALGPALKAVYRFGSDIARGKGTSQERLLVLVEDIDRDLLDRASDPIWAAQKEGVRVRVDSVKNLVRGADAFPAFALELRDHRALVHGTDVLADLTVSPTHLRLHVEQGLRSMQRDLVRLYLERGARPDELRELRRNLRKLAYLLEGALLAAQKPAPRPLSLEGAISACCSTLLAGKSTAPWQTLSQLAVAEDGLAQHRAALYAALFDALAQIIDVVDQLEAS
jgi:hypothetical protein